MKHAVPPRLPASFETGAEWVCIVHPTRRQKAVKTRREDIVGVEQDEDAMVRAAIDG